MTQRDFVCAWMAGVPHSNRTSRVWALTTRAAQGLHETTGHDWDYLVGVLCWARTWCKPQEYTLAGFRTVLEVYGKLERAAQEQGISIGEATYQLQQAVGEGSLLPKPAGPSGTAAARAVCGQVCGK